MIVNGMLVGREKFDPQKQRTKFPWCTIIGEPQTLFFIYILLREKGCVPLKTFMDFTVLSHC